MMCCGEIFCRSTYLYFTSLYGFQKCVTLQTKLCSYHSTWLNRSRTRLCTVSSFNVNHVGTDLPINAMLFDACKKLLTSNIPKRTIFGALNAIFNGVNPSRVKLVGPDRACAEWLMRNGAHIKWVGSEDYVTHYDNLPLDPEDQSTYHIKEIYAKDASISHHGFPHLRGCKHISSISLIHCIFVTDNCMDSLVYVKDTLETLEIRRCPELTQNGLLKLGDLGLQNLTSLMVGSLSRMKPEELLDAVQCLQQALPLTRVEMLCDE